MALKARQKLGKYRIERRISEGPIAAVYEAVDTIHGLHVALKIPHESSMSEHFLADFKREARLAHRLEHPNILPIRDASFIADRFVIAMPLGERSLASRMRRRLSTESALHLIEQAVAAVAHAHRANVIHCDIKPDNFILFPDNRLKLTDFGFSKVARRHAEGVGLRHRRLHRAGAGRRPAEVPVGRVLARLGHLRALVRLPARVAVRLAAARDQACARARRREARRLAAACDSGAARKAVQERGDDVPRVQARAQRRRPRRSARAPSSEADDPSLWQTVLFRQFRRKYGKSIEARYRCRHCAGPVSELMQCCPWCGTEPPLDRHRSRHPADCPRCHRGVKTDWHYCPSCYGPGFEVETTRRYSDKRYSATVKTRSAADR